MITSATRKHQYRFIKNRSGRAEKRPSKPVRVASTFIIRSIHAVLLHCTRNLNGASRGGTTRRDATRHDNGLHFDKIDTGASRRELCKNYVRPRGSGASRGALASIRRMAFQPVPRFTLRFRAGSGSLTSLYLKRAPIKRDNISQSTSNAARRQSSLGPRVQTAPNLPSQRERPRFKRGAGCLTIRDTPVVCR